MYEMKPEYYTGIALLDEEHTKLFGLAEAAYQLMQDEFLTDKFDDLLAIVQELKEYTLTHFAHEEAYMEEIDYQAIFIQKAQHKAFREKLEELDLDEIDANQEEAIADLLKFLTDWLVGHILKLDKLIGQEA